MKKYLVLFLVFYSVAISNCCAQNKSGNTWVFGLCGTTATFSDTSRPVADSLYPLFMPPNYPFLFMRGHSDICDSTTGKLLFVCNGMRIYDTIGYVIENGDSLQPNKIYMHNCCPTGAEGTQGSLILPKGSNGLYYVFTPTITDSMYDYLITNPLGDGRFPYDLLQYHIVDMNANAGMGKVIQKNIQLLANVEMSKVGMMACRHANGYDWWLLKQASDTNMIYTFLITKDTVLLDTIQGFGEPHYGYSDLQGQSCFSTDGSKYAYVQSKTGILFLADFDRCTGVLSNSKLLNIPMDTTTIPNPPPQYYWDSVINGVCFSPNDSFLYITRRYNIYQYELNEPDSALAWYLVKHGEDTTLQQFAYYGQLQLGIDNRIYIGKGGGTANQNSVIDKPNIKGIGCEFCRKCLRYDYGCATSSPPNMPNFNLGPKTPCWPLSNEQLTIESGQLEVYPNPVSSKLYISNADKKKKELYNSVGQLLFSTNANEIDVSKYSKGIYYIKCGNAVKKVVIE